MKKLLAKALGMPLGALVLASILGPLSAYANTLDFTGSSGTLSAGALFSLTGNTLTVTLTNTSSADVLVPIEVLTGVFFDTTHKLTPVSASLNGSTVYYGSIVHNVGEGWAYASSISAHGENTGISAAGLGLFGQCSFYSTCVTPLDGLNYGILSAGDNSATGNSGVTGHGPLIKDSVQFTLTAASGFTLSELGNSVVFQYGTSLSDTSYSGSAPEASTVTLTSLVLLAFGALLVRSRRNELA